MAVDPTIVVACIAVVPTTVASLAAWRAVNKGRADMQTGNGVSPGGMILKIHDNQVRHETDPNAHQILRTDDEDVV